MRPEDIETVLGKGSMSVERAIELQLRRLHSSFTASSLTVEELQRIRQIAAERARDIIAGRPWESVDALARIDGIGPATLRDIHTQGVACMP